MMVKKITIEQAEEKLKQYRLTINWYGIIVIYLLNRVENLPQAIKELIRTASYEKVRKFGIDPEKEIKEVAK